MSEMIRIVVDAMGGDNAPKAPVRGAVDALNAQTGFVVVLTGKEEIIKKELEGLEYPSDRLIIKNATEVIGMGDHPVESIREKKDSSVTVGLGMVRNGEANGFVSAGNTGAVIAGAQFIIGRLKGIKRSPLAMTIPSEKGPVLLLDAGANVDCRPDQLLLFAKMGSIYMENIIGVKNPRVGLVNIGTEDEKGNAQTRETMPLLRDCPDINYAGYCEAREIPKGVFDVVVCDAFVGNVILKLYEGVSASLIGIIKKGLMSSLRSKIGALLVKPALKNTLKKFDIAEYGGAPLLGLKGLVIKTHGSSEAVEVKNSILQCYSFCVNEVNEKIKKALEINR